METKIVYRVSAHLDGERRAALVALPADIYAVSGLSEDEAQLVVENDFGAYRMFYDGVTDDATYEAEWESIEIEFEGVIVD